VAKHDITLTNDTLDSQYSELAH